MGVFGDPDAAATHGLEILCDEFLCDLVCRNGSFLQQEDIGAFVIYPEPSFRIAPWKNGGEIVVVAIRFPSIIQHGSAADEHFLAESFWEDDPILVGDGNGLEIERIEKAGRGRCRCRFGGLGAEPVGRESIRGGNDGPRAEGLDEVTSIGSMHRQVKLEESGEPTT